MTKDQQNITIDRNAVAKRAFELYVARGRKDGHAESDWIRAENEIRQAQQKNAKVATPTPLAAKTTKTKSSQTSRRLS